MQQSICHACKKPGHLKAVCRTQRNGFQLDVRTSAPSKAEQEKAEMLRCRLRYEELNKKYNTATNPTDQVMTNNSIHLKKPVRTAPIVPCCVGKAPTTCLLDTGAGASSAKTNTTD
eukprot:GHVO01004624.1.p1 GENE.GHVO01004624.1~~GHVO01004624.1.p1  ORF type:complete len:116 (+),score=14.85 GHVO01004624.1:116-463(+)